MVDTNKKLPVNPGKDILKADPRYLEINVSGDGGGYQINSPIDPSEAKKSFFKEQWTSSGTYESIQADEKKGEVRTSLLKESRIYNTGGSSFTSEGSMETYVKDTRKDTTEGDISREVGGNEFIAVADQSIMTSKNGFIHNQAAGSSDATSYVMSEGDYVEERSGNYLSSTKGDDVKIVKGSYFRAIADGDVATHVQSGNFDLQVTSGKLHIMTSGDDLIANSNVKVLLQVGSNAKITMDPSMIKLQVGGGSYIEITSGGIKMVSPRIDLN